MTALIRVSAAVPPAHAEEARAAALELAPAGFEETESGDLLTLSFYVERRGWPRFAPSFPKPRSRP